MPTLRQRILELLQRRNGLTDREITDELFTIGAAQQPINQACRALESQKLISRKRRDDGKIGNYITGLFHTEPFKGSIPSVLPSDPLSENGVKLHLKNWLESHGWQVSVVWGKERGIDIDAFKDSRRWIIEAKGSGSLNPMRVNYFLMILGETLQRMSDSKAKYSVALPDLPQFRNLWTRLPRLAKSRTKISILFVDSEGNIDEVK